MLLPAGTAIAQTVGLDLPSGEDLLIHDTGWGLLLNPTEIIVFVLDVIVTLLLTAAIAYHPIIRADRNNIRDLDLPVSLFVYGMIGMVVGFLVIHHGYLIGFVIFGIGGLLRFRSSGESPRETVRMILVTVIGLCVGLDVPPMAVLITAVAWTIFYVFGRMAHHSVELKFVDAKRSEEGIRQVKDLLTRFGARVVKVNRGRFKASAEIVFTIHRELGLRAIAEELNTVKNPKHGPVADWYMT